MGRYEMGDMGPNPPQRYCTCFECFDAHAHTHGIGSLHGPEILGRYRYSCVSDVVSVALAVYWGAFFSENRFFSTFSCSSILSYLLFADRNSDHEALSQFAIHQ